MEVEEYRRIVENLRLSIRKKQVHRILDHQRRIKEREFEAELRGELEQNLQKHEERETWIQQIAAILSGEPGMEWTPVLKKLYLALPLF
jgi:hypothetical protein